MCDDERALLRNIKANPDDDLPRLVYADWLEERGRDKRALMIRDQVADPTPRDEMWTELSGAVYKRGFIVEVRSYMRGWLDHGPAICAQETVERVVIIDRSPMSTDRQGQSRVYFWIPNNWVDPYTAHIPYEIIGEDKFRKFNTSDDAKNWLFTRCVEWANSQFELVCHP